MAGSDKFRLVWLSETICFAKVQRKGKFSVANVWFRYVFQCCITVICGWQKMLKCCACELTINKE